VQLSPGQGQPDAEVRQLRPQGEAPEKEEIQMKIQYQDHHISEVINYFVQGFEPNEGLKVVQHEANYDPHTGRIWFKLFVEEPQVVEPEAKD
jgi:hypothetical protein